MRTLKANELEALKNFREVLAAESEKAQQILMGAEAYGYQSIIFNNTEAITGALDAVLSDNTKQQEYEKYLGNYKGTISSQDLYIEVKSVEPDEAGDTYYYGTQSVYVGGKAFERDFIMDAEQFKDCVDTEIYKRIE